MPSNNLGFVKRWFGSPASVQRGMPAPMGAADMRTLPTVAPQLRFGMAINHLSMEYSRGADAWGYRSGVMERNPIGAGVVFTDKLPIFPGSVGTYLAGAILWGTPFNPLSGPAHSPLLTPGEYAALGLM